MVDVPPQSDVTAVATSCAVAPLSRVDGCTANVTTGGWFARRRMVTVSDVEVTPPAVARTATVI